MKFTGKHAPVTTGITFCLLVTLALFSGLPVVAQDTAPTPADTSITVTQRLFYDDGLLGLELAWSPNGTYIAMDKLNNEVVLYDAETGSVVRTLEGMRNWSSYLVWSPDSRYLAAGGSDELQMVWDADSGERLSQFFTDLYGSDAAWSPDSRYVASIAYDSLIILDIQQP